MSVRYSTVRGTRDLLPPETRVWAAVEETARQLFESYGYGEIRTPILEEYELFVRTVGDTTDIVGKEMYSFLDRKGRHLCLRPESTAPVARAFVQHGLREWPQPVKLFYIGPQFRYEKPQAGRYRQFSQIGAEVFGDEGPWTDVELLLMLTRFLDRLGFAGLTVLVNTVGDRESRQRYGEALRAWLEPHRERLGEDSRRRLETNPLRILDTKAPEERALLEGAPTLHDHLTDESRRHFGLLLEALGRFGVDYRVDDRLVRGLDYYTRTVFEIVSEDLGAQNAILGGGRYDSLVSDLGGPEVPGIGFAIGLDRLIEILPASFREQHGDGADVMVVSAGTVGVDVALEIAEQLRGGRLTVLAEVGGRSMKSALKQADRRGVRWVVVIGDDELAAGEVTLKDFRSGDQERIARQRLAAVLEERT